MMSLIYGIYKNWTHKNREWNGGDQDLVGEGTEEILFKGTAYLQVEDK